MPLTFEQLKHPSPTQKYELYPHCCGELLHPELPITDCPTCQAPYDTMDIARRMLEINRPSRMPQNS